MNKISIDIETYCDIDLKKQGLYKYVESSSFEIMLIAYKINHDPVKVFSPLHSAYPPEFLEALYSPDFTKHAFNAQFEFTCFSKVLERPLNIKQWFCTMIHGAMCGLPLSLDQVGKALRIPVKKDSAGTILLNYFAKPCKPTKTNGGRIRNLPEHDPDKWKQLVNYNKTDVIAEDAVYEKVKFYQIPKQERLMWLLDQKINRRGVTIDLQFVNNCLTIYNNQHNKLMGELRELTGLANPNSNKQLLEYLQKEFIELPIYNLQAETIKELVESCEDQESSLYRILSRVQELKKTSLKKYIAAKNNHCSDLKLRGLLQYYGANRTGRWAGRLFQVQNIPRMDIEGLDTARELVKEMEEELLADLFGNVPKTLSQLIRTTLVAGKDKILIASDFKAIEARVTAWLTREEWRLEVFKSHGKIYEASAAAMFRVPFESITKDSPMRQKGKVAELALGFQGGVGALIRMGALKMGLKEKELGEIKIKWREASPNIVRYWYSLQSAALTCVAEHREVKANKITFTRTRDYLFIRLPSGRKLSYYKPRIDYQLDRNGFEKPYVSYLGLDQVTQKWARIPTYGGKLFENIVQGTARDLLAHAMLKVNQAGYDLIFHVHDELVIESDLVDADRDMKAVHELVKTGPKWSAGLPLDADTFKTLYYKK